MSATAGDMVVDRGDSLGWYDGPTLLQILETVDVEESLDLAPSRFPVQYVARPTADVPRRYLGRIESGSLAVGDDIFAIAVGPAYAHPRHSQLRRDRCRARACMQVSVWCWKTTSMSRAAT